MARPRQPHANNNNKNNNNNKTKNNTALRSQRPAFTPIAIRLGTTRLGDPRQLQEWNFAYGTKPPQPKHPQMPRHSANTAFFHKIAHPEHLANTNMNQWEYRRTKTWTIQIFAAAWRLGNSASLFELVMLSPCCWRMLPKNPSKNGASVLPQLNCAESNPKKSNIEPNQTGVILARRREGLFEIALNRSKTLWLTSRPIQSHSKIWNAETKIESMPFKNEILKCHMIANGWPRSVCYRKWLLWTFVMKEFVIIWDDTFQPCLSKFAIITVAWTFVAQISKSCLSQLLCTSANLVMAHDKI